MRGDSPPLQMTVDGLKLVPASAWDAERLASYRNRAKVSVVITEEVASWARRRYWAILGKVVQTCNLPPRVRDAQGLHDAIRKQIGFVDSHSSDGKTLTVKLRSTKNLDDQEFASFAAEAYAELTEMTGVDVETLGKESADVGPNEQESSSVLSGSDDAGSDDTDPQAPQPQGVVAAEPTAAADLQETGDAAVEGTPVSTPIEVLKLKAEAVEKLLAIAVDPTLPDVADRRDVLERAKDVWKLALPGHHDFVKAAVSTTDKVIRGKMPIGDAREYLAALVK